MKSKTAKKVIEDVNMKKELDEQFKEYLLLGSLLYKDNKDGSLTWIPRL